MKLEEKLAEIPTVKNENNECKLLKRLLAVKKLDKMHCEYVSDLLFVDYERIRIHLEYMDQNDFELKEILDAISWFGGTVPEEATKDNAWSALLELKR